LGAQLFVELQGKCALHLLCGFAGGQAIQLGADIGHAT
jgi:hypothetical protein